MNDVFDRSPVSLLSSSDAGRAAEVRLMNGQVSRGRIREILSKEARLILDVEPEGVMTEYPFASLRVLAFLHPVEPAAVAAFQKRANTPVAKVPQKFAITYVDDKELAGLALTFAVDRDGVHLLQAQGSRILQEFVPLGVVRHCECDPKIGQALIADNHVSATLVEGAYETQKLLREKKIGEYLSHLVEADDLKSVLDGQSSDPLLQLGELLVREGHISRKQLNDAIAAQRRNRKKKIGDILVEMGAIRREVINATLAKKLGFPVVKLRDVLIEPEVLSLVTAELARKHSVMPYMLQDGDLVVAFENPMDINAANMLRFTTKHRIRVTIASREDIQWAIRFHYDSAGQDSDVDAMEVSAIKENQEDQEWLEAERLGKEKPIVKFVNNTILDAIRRRASDVHLSPGDAQTDLMFRIDGTMIKIRSLKNSLLAGIVSRIKIMCNMDITERRLPQDGGARVIHEGKTVDLRVSVIPTTNGESVVIRILDTEVGQKSISEIGFSPHDERAFTNLLSRNSGIILVTGPTGSGKTTTLYAALGEIIRRNVNVITVEDPVEYHISGIKQIQVNTATGFTFAGALRHILRHDPDVIMIGEIRDGETAKIAIESSLTGHLVLSTLHTNSAASAIVRLMELGVESYLLNSSVLGVVAQRLVRHNCPKCIAEEEVEPNVRAALQVGKDEVFYRGQGCAQCNQTGYFGRVAVYEILLVTPELRSQIVPGVTADEIHRVALGEGMVPLTKNALVQARLRKTSLAEVYEVRQE